jgi:hypothetical protein
VARPILPVEPSTANLRKTFCDGTIETDQGVYSSVKLVPNAGERICDSLLHCNDHSQNPLPHNNLKPPETQGDTADYFDEAESTQKNHKLFLDTILQHRFSLIQSLCADYIVSQFPSEKTLVIMKLKSCAMF